MALTMESVGRQERRGLYSLSSIARRLGVLQQTLNYHRHCGYIPTPATGRYYTAEQVKQIEEYWTGLESAQ